MIESRVDVQSPESSVEVQCRGIVDEQQAARLEDTNLAQERCRHVDGIANPSGIVRAVCTLTRRSRFVVIRPGMWIRTSLTFGS